MSHKGHFPSGGGVAFGEGLRVDFPLVEDAVVVQGAVLVVAFAFRVCEIEIVGQVTAPERGADVHVKGQRGRPAVASYFGGNQRIGLEVCANPALGLRNAQPKESGGVKIVVILGGENRLTVPKFGPSGKLRLSQLAGLCGELDLFRSQLPRFRVKNGGITR